MLPVRYALPLVLIAAVAVPAVAQEDQVLRQTIPYFDRTLTVEVTTPAAGTLRLLRGGRNARIEVAARAANGVAGVALGGYSRDRLRLEASGTGRVEYLVIVPEDIRVQVQLPRQDYALAAPAEPSATYVWPSTQEADYSVGLSGVRTGDVLYLIHSAAVAPDEIALEDLAAVRRLAIRTGGPEFRLETSRPMSSVPGTERRIAIRAAGEPLDIVITLPSNTRNFSLRVPEAVAFAIVDGAVEVNCGPSTSQVLTDGRRWVDITPVDGVLDCTASRLPVPGRSGARGLRGMR